MIDLTNTLDAERLLTAIADAGATPPQELTDTVAGIKAFGSATAAVGDATADLIDKVIAGDLRGRALDEAIAAAANAQRVAEYRAGLRQRVVRPGMQKFVAALKEGAADQIIESLTPAFDAAAAALLKIKEAVEPGVSAEAFLASADADGLAAWREIDQHVETLDKIATVITQFGPHGAFEMVQPPQGPVAAWAGEIDRRALLFTGPDTSIAAAGEAFRACQGGRHRASAWFKLAGVLQLCSIAAAREKVRAWSEATHAAIVPSDNGRGRLTDSGFVPTPIPNPYAKVAV